MRKMVCAETVHYFVDVLSQGPLYAQTHDVAKDDLESPDLLVSASQVLGLQAQAVIIIQCWEWNPRPSACFLSTY